MPIPAPYLVGLQMYEIDDEALALRAEVWRHLGPMMHTICDRHFGKILKFTDALLRRVLEKNRGRMAPARHPLHLPALSTSVRREICRGCTGTCRNRNRAGRRHADARHDRPVHPNQFQPRTAAAILASTPQSPSTHRRRATRADVGCCQCHGSPLFGASAGGEKTRQRA